MYSRDEEQGGEQNHGIDAHFHHYGRASDKIQPPQKFTVLRRLSLILAILSLLDSIISGIFINWNVTDIGFFIGILNTLVVNALFYCLVSFAHNVQFAHKVRGLHIMSIGDRGKKRTSTHVLFHFLLTKIVFTTYTIEKELYIYCFLLPICQKENVNMQDPHLETLIKTYNNSGEYKRGAAKLIERGWTIKDTSQGQRNRSLAGKVIVPFGMFTKPTEILVTYERAAGATVSPNVKLSGTEKKYVPLGMPPGLPFMQQAEWIKTHKGENL